MPRADGAAGVPAGARTSRYVGWLPALVPVDARRFRVQDPRLRAALAAAGAELVTDGPDVEIGAAAELRGDAACALVPIDPYPPEGGSLGARATRALTGPILVRARAERARLAALRLGYRKVRVVVWERGSSLHLPTPLRVRRSRRGLRRPPPAAIVTASRTGPAVTALEAAAAASSEALTRALHEAWPLATLRMTIVLGERQVLRVGIGPAALALRRQHALLASLWENPIPAVVAERLPAIVRSGRAGLAEWTAETRLPGTTPPAAAGAGFVRDCVDFLAGLQSIVAPREETQSLQEAARTVGACCRPEHAPLVAELASEIEVRLHDVPRGYSHGDFAPNNLLAEGDRLLGVVDWEMGRRDGLPLTDLYHLRLSVWRTRERLPLGAAVVGYLLPLARRGGDEMIRDYCARVGLPADPSLLEAIVIAYWLEIVPHLIQNVGGFPVLPIWARNNIDTVLESLQERRVGRATAP